MSSLFPRPHLHDGDYRPMLWDPAAGDPQQVLRDRVEHLLTKSDSIVAALRYRTTTTLLFIIAELVAAALDADESAPLLTDLVQEVTNAVTEYMHTHALEAPL